MRERGPMFDPRACAAGPPRDPSGTVSATNDGVLTGYVGAGTSGPGSRTGYVRPDASRHGAQHGTAGTAQHSTAQHGTARRRRKRTQVEARLDGEGSGGARYRGLVMRRSAAAPEAAVLVLHGGREHGMSRPSRLNAPGLRMRPFVRALARATEGRRVVLAEARYRHSGWNGERADAARDAAEALAELNRRTGGAPVVLVGHSMGGRAALRVAGTAGVVGTVGLAPWCPPGEPVAQLSAARLVFLHAEADRTTSPEESLRMAERARAEGAEVCRFVLPGGDHAMLRQAAVWHTLTTRAVCGLLGLTALPPEVAAAFALPPGSRDGLEVPAALGDGRGVRV